MRRDGGKGLDHEVGSWAIVPGWSPGPQHLGTVSAAPAKGARALGSVRTQNLLPTTISKKVGLLLNKIL